MSWVLEWADSELAAIERRGDELLLRLAAARLRQDGQGRYAIGVVLVLEQAEAESDAAGLFGTLEAGQLLCDGQRCPPLALGQRLHGTLQLELQLRRGPSWRARAQALQLPPLQGLVLHEDLSC